jgi:NAD(P)-dependent dehydrogenase (short-subunit alcohol dehydrogenase family)
MPVYVITGANRGLGLEFVRQIASNQDNTIVACARSSSSDLTDVKAVANSNTQFLTCDTGDVDSIKTFAQELSKTLHGKKIDFLLNNAGVNASPEQTSLTLSPEALYENVQINIVGPAKTVENLHSAGLLSDNVRILNMTSGLGSMERSATITPRKCAPYSISKAGLNMLTVHQSGELRETLPGCVVIVMDPGWVKTRMGGEGAILEPETSIGGMLKTLHGLKSEDNGKFYTHDGSEVPW